MFVDLYIAFLRKFSNRSGSKSGRTRMESNKDEYSSEWWFPWKSLLALFLITLVALICQDVTSKESLEASRTGQLLKDLGAFEPADKFLQQMSKKYKEFSKFGRKEWPKLYKNWRKETKAMFKKYSRKCTRHFEYFTNWLNEMVPGSGSLLFNIGHGTLYLLYTFIETLYTVVYTVVTVLYHSLKQMALIIWHVASNTIGAQEAFADISAFGAYAYSQVVKNLRTSIDAIKAILA